MLNVKNLKKNFGGHAVLRGIDINVEKGDVVAVLGPSGSGKTTLLRCLNFLEQADSGTMDFDGRQYYLGKVHHKDIAEIRKKTAFVFQNYNLFANKTAVENVTEGLLIARNIPKVQANEIGRQMLQKVGLADRMNYYPGELSGGQQQRVGIARALATDPEIIYIDEPTSALDPELIGEVLAVMRQLAEEGRTMVVVTHEMNFARNVSNKILFMDGGFVLESADSKEFFDNPQQERAKAFLNTIVNRQQD
jgi:cystine transport system ATP-binding protein